MTLTMRKRPWLACGVALMSLAAVTPAYGQFSGGFGGHSVVPRESFPGVTLDGPRELDPDAPAVIDEAWFVPPELQKPLTWDVVELPLDDLAAEFSSRVGLPVLIDESALKDVGIPLDEPMTASIEDVPAYLLLERAFTHLGASLPHIGVTWYVEDGIIHVTKTEWNDKRMETTVYSIGDLLQADCTMQSLIDTLQSETDAHWLDIDGVGGSVSQAGPTLVIRQTQQVQWEIAGILKALRHPRRQTVVGDSVLREAIEKKLDQTLMSVDFAEVPLEDAIAHLGRETGIPVQVNRFDLIDVGIEHDTPVSLQLENRRARTMFRLVLSSLGLTTLNRDAVLQVTSLDVAEKRMLIVVYEVSDLCRTEDQTNTLIDVLQSETDGDWEDIDGIGGTISMPRVGTLVLSQTERVQREIAGILEQLRETLGDETLENPANANDDQLDTRYYHLPQQQAHDLQVLLQTLIEPESWEHGDDVGMIRVISNDPQLTPTGEKAAVVELPRAILMVRHQRAVLKKIERFLAEMSRDSRDEGGFFGNTGYIPAGGGFGAIPTESEP